MGKKHITNDSPDFPKGIDIDKLTDEEFIKFAKLLYDSDGNIDSNCNGRSCSECPWDRHSYTGKFETMDCGIIGRTINQRFCDLMFGKVFKDKQEEKASTSRPKEQTCIYCEHYNRQLGDGYKFCNWWHNFTRSDGYCFAFSPKEKEGV